MNDPTRTVIFPFVEWSLLMPFDAWPMPPDKAAFIVDTLFRDKRWQAARWN